MRQKILIGLSFIICHLSFTVSHAQPSWVKKAAKSVFTVKTFADDGTLLGSATGFFTSDDGEAMSSYMPMKGAYRAVVIDASGKEATVKEILGASETYDVVKFRVEAKKTTPLAMATEKQPVGSTVWLLPFRETKQPVQGNVTGAETFNGEYEYLTISMKAPEGNIGAPVMNETGQAVGLLQSSDGQKSNVSYAVSARFVDSLKITGLSINDPVLRAINIKKALPADYSQAQLMLYLASAQMDSIQLTQLADEIIAAFPEEADGYIYRAQIAASGKNYAEADQFVDKAIGVSRQKDDVHYAYSRMILQKMVSDASSDYPSWTFGKALQEAETAYALNPLPAYREQQARTLFAEKRYGEAGKIYEELTKTSLRSHELFYTASQCRVLSGDTVGQLALLDSAVAMFSKPYLKEAAGPLVARAQAREAAGLHREAVSDYNEYEQLMATQVNAYFYYLRHQAEMGGRLYQQALNDITKAAEKEPGNDVYITEKASLEVRFGLYDQAIETAHECISRFPDLSDGYLFLGVAQCLSGKKTEGVSNLKRAGELGDEQAEALIEKYGK